MGIIKNIILTILMTVTTIAVSAQMGVRIKYLKNGINDDQKQILQEEAFAPEEVLNTGFGLGVDYWFRLKNKRIEFLPEIGINFAQSEYDQELEITDQPEKLQHRSVYFNMNTRIYPMDFAGDCDCPTFSNQSTLIKKGFYFELSPGISYYRSNISTSQVTFAGTETDVRTTENDEISYKIGLGVGLDIGISNLLTINPYAMYNFHFGHDYATLISKLNAMQYEYGTTSSQLELGVRFAFRFDASKY